MEKDISPKGNKRTIQVPDAEILGDVEVLKQEKS